ncbi:MAG: hypothetical protein KAJ07_09100 [Planctomycetes bacterium]|nr:hypothetical protein [Planctomycetota bacterium]
MKLLCTEISTVVGTASIARELGWSVGRVNRLLRIRGVKPTGNRGFANCNVYDCRYVRQVFENENFVSESEV